MKPIISIIIINFNGLEYLKRTLPSVLGLKYPDYEIIVVDNGSHDGSVEYLRRQNRVHLIQSPVYASKNYAANYGAKKASGEYILFLDNDVILTCSNLLQELLSIWQGQEKIGLISLCLKNEKEEKIFGYGCFVSFIFSYNKKNISCQQALNLHLSLIGTPQGAAFFISKENWELLQGYDTHLLFGGDDNDIGQRLWLLKFKNILYSASVQIHIGMPERKNHKKYARKFSLIVYANLYTIVKNFRFFNGLAALFLSSGFFFLKSIKQSVVRKNFLPFCGFFKGFFWFLIHLKTAFQKRKEVQKSRVIQKDIFLKIRPNIK